MTENVLETLSSGLSHFFKNPILCLSPIFSYLVAIIFVFVVAGGLFLFFGTAFLTNPSPAMPSISTASIVSAIILFIVLLVLITFLSSYLSAGLIGMCKEVEVFGKTTFETLISYGNKFCVRVFGATILLSFFQLLSLIFILPAVYQLLNTGITSQMLLDAVNQASVGNSEALTQIILTALNSSAVLFVLGFFLMLAYLLIYSFFFYFPIYAIVIDDLSVMAGIKKSYVLFKAKAIDIAIFILLIFFITIAFTWCSYFIAPIFSLAPFLKIIWTLISFIFDIFIITLTAIWSVRRYIILTEQPVYKEEDLLSY
ncbi:hypothetical protein [Methanolapillus ohkumae]|uniref:DUF7847 domain-containing protein n=1 Tax=Methanolapillus ohkumae TaxID=3028298 RepID=A0AA96V7A4_9EURY|nr:hypothetical protein MsAm2_06930 [Methanosarcinaceae archaeon Am2]